MKLSTKVRYGVRAMIDLALEDNGEPILVKSIAERQEISKKYLESLLASLKAAGLVRSVRGAKGGYKLAQDPAAVTIEQITNALDGPPILVECVEDAGLCSRSDACVTRDLWKDMTDGLISKLRSKTLADLVREAQKKERKTKAPAKAKAKAK
jgi:Rrf2 family transcriptional regulator, cysteine metabolism repressor